MNDSPLKRFWRVIYPLGLYIVMQLAVIFVVEMILFSFFMTQATASGSGLDMVRIVGQVTELLVGYTYEITVVSAVLTLPFLILFYRMDMKRTKRAGTYKTYEKVPLWQYLLVAGLGFCVCVAGNNLITFSGLMNVSDGYVAVTQALYKGQFWLELFGIGLVVPAVEELIFRGLMYKRFREFLSPVLSGVVTSLAFGVFHGNLVQGVYAFLISAALCFVLERYHSFFAPYILHGVANVISVIVSETAGLEIFFREGPVFYVTTLVCAALVVLFVYLIDKKVSPGQLQSQNSV